MLLLAGCNGSTKGCREPYRERKGILGISWRIESFKLIFPKYDDCRNPGIIAEDDWKLFLFDGVKNAGAELDYDLIEPRIAPTVQHIGIRIRARRLLSPATR